MPACFVSQSVCQTFSRDFLHRSCLFNMFNAKADQVHIWFSYALQCGEYNAGGFVGVK